MSNEAPINYQQKFYDDFIMLSQQKDARLMGAVRDDPDNLQGKAGHFDRIGKTAAKKKTVRHGDTPLVHTPHSRRRIILTEFEWADLIDKADLVKLGRDPRNKYVMNANYAMNREKDKLIVAAALGNAVSTDEDDVASNVPLPAGQKIAVAASGLTLTKILSAKEIIDFSDVDDDEPRYMAVTAKQVTNLLNTTEITNADYNTVKALAEGRVDTFAGFKFIRLSGDVMTFDGNGDRQVIAWAKRGVGIAIGQEIETDVGPRRDKSMSIQVYLNMLMDATRIEDEKVVEIACQEA